MNWYLHGHATDRDPSGALRSAALGALRGGGDAGLLPAAGGLHDRRRRRRPTATATSGSASPGRRTPTWPAATTRRRWRALKPAQVAVGTSNGMAFFPTPDRPGINCCANRCAPSPTTRTTASSTTGSGDGGYGAVTPSALVPGTSTGMTTLRPARLRIDLGDVAPAPSRRRVAHREGDQPEHGHRARAYYAGARLAFFDGRRVERGPEHRDPERPDTLINARATTPSRRASRSTRTGAPWFVEEEPGLPGYRIAT